MQVTKATYSVTRRSQHVAVAADTLLNVSILVARLSVQSRMSSSSSADRPAQVHRQRILRIVSLHLPAAELKAL